MLRRLLDPCRTLTRSLWAVVWIAMLYSLSIPGLVELLGMRGWLGRSLTVALFPQGPLYILLVGNILAAKLCGDLWSSEPAAKQRSSDPTLLRVVIAGIAVPLALCGSLAIAGAHFVHLIAAAMTYHPFLVVISSRMWSFRIASARGTVPAEFTPRWISGEDRRRAKAAAGE